MGSRRAATLLALYAAVLAGIAFWPVPVDSGAGPFLRAITRAAPWLTYNIIEFSSNIVLFVPFGVLVSLAWPRVQGAVVFLALVATVIIESGQGIFLASRTPSLRDVVANVLGAAIGLAIVTSLQAMKREEPASVVVATATNNGGDGEQGADEQEHASADPDAHHGRAVEPGSREASVGIGHRDGGSTTG